jgi:hypothetical protein
MSKKILYQQRLDHVGPVQAVHAVGPEHARLVAVGHLLAGVGGGPLRSEEAVAAVKVRAEKAVEKGLIFIHYF